MYDRCSITLKLCHCFSNKSVVKSVAGESAGGRRVIDLTKEMKERIKVDLRVRIP